MRRTLKHLWVKSIGPSSHILLLFIILSSIFWMATKLSQTYTEYVPVKINLEGTEFQTQCIVRATGYDIFYQKHINNEVINIKKQSVHLSRLRSDSTLYAVDRVSLLNVISTKYRNITFISVGNVPNIKLEQK